MNKATLILGAAPRVAVPIARSLQRLGVPCIVGIFSEKNSALGSNAVHRTARLPQPRDHAGFLSGLLTLLETENVDTIFPGSDLAMRGIGDHYERLSKLAYPGCPPPDVCAAVLEKQRTYDTARACGIELPPSYLAPTLADLDALRGRIQFPVIVKRSSAAIAGSFKIRQYFSFEALRLEYVSDPTIGGQTILQQYDGGEGIGLAVIMHDGHVLAPFQYRSVRELPTTGGVSCVVEADTLDGDLLARTTAMLRAMRWSGVAMVEYIRDRATGAYRLLEVNGRYWGCLALAMQAGHDYPAYEWRIAHGMDPGIAPAYRVGTRSRWTGGLIRRLGGVGGEAHTRLLGTTRLQEFTATISDFAPRTQSALWLWRDPVPAIWDVASALAGLVRDLSESVARFVRRRGRAIVASQTQRASASQ
jgi:predicted ATP-grasp superfamily ATP-dependent carboligase